MAHILIMPRQGNTVESCVITGWKVKEGDTVTAETAVCEVETDKAAFEVPAGAAGTVLKILHAAGDDVPVLEPIAVIGAAGEDWEKLISQEISHGDTEARREKEEERDKKEKVEGKREEGRDKKEKVEDKREDCRDDGDRDLQSPVPDPQSPLVLSPRARKLAEKEALSPEKVPGTGPGGRIIERDVLAALENRPALTAAAKAAAGSVPAAGTGIGGRVTVADLAAAPQPQVPIPQSPTPEYTETAIKGIRKIISDRMHQSLAETAQFTLNASAPAQRLQDIRSRIKNSDEALGLSKITVNDLILFAVSRVLPQFPYMNARKTGDILKTYSSIHLGVAVDTPRGLMVPVIRNANLLSLGQISQEAKRLVAACQSGTVRRDELSLSTFTVTNLGSFGITGFTPVLNFPEVAILGVCNIELKPVPSDHSPFRIEPHIGLSLTIDHQVVDGAPAARFLKALCEALADIDLLLLTDNQGAQHV